MPERSTGVRSAAIGRVRVLYSGRLVKPVTISAAPMTIEEVLDVARGARIEIGDDAWRTIRASRAVLDEALAADQPVYGVNRGVGHGKDTRVPVEEMRHAQVRILETHAGGTGPPLRADLVRAAMVVRLNGIARGGSAASPRVAEVLVGMLNAGIEPVVPSGGSVGAGDLGQLASVGRVMIGRGRARYGNDVLSASDALERAGIEPLEVEPKDGLTITSSNAVSIGHGAIVVSRAERLAQRADVVAATSLEAVGGNPSVARPIVAAAKPPHSSSVRSIPLRARMLLVILCSAVVAVIDVPPILLDGGFG